MTRRVALLGAALAGLLALVAAAAAVHDARSDGGDDTAGLPPAVAAYGYSLVVLVAIVGLPVLVLLAIREVPEARQRGRRTWLTPLAIAAIAVAGVAVSAYGGDGFSDVLGRLRIVHPSRAEAEASTPPAAQSWLPVLLLTGLALGGGALVLRRRPRDGTDSLSDRVADALGAPLDDLRTEPDVRRAVIAAFARLELALEAAGAPRSVGEAPLEYVDRVLGALAVPPEPTAALAALFEQAKFSLHPLDGADRSAAIDALEAVREALR